VQNNKRFYCSGELVSGHEVRLEGDRAHYLRNVLRIKSGEQIHCFNEGAGEFEAMISTVSKKSVVIQVGEKIKSMGEPPLKIHLGQVISRGGENGFCGAKRG